MDYLLLPSRISAPPQPLQSTDVVDEGEVRPTSVSQFNSATTIAYVNNASRTLGAVIESRSGSECICKRTGQ